MLTSGYACVHLQIPLLAQLGPLPFFMVQRAGNGSSKCAILVHLVDIITRCSSNSTINTILLFSRIRCIATRSLSHNNIYGSSISLTASQIASNASSTVRNVSLGPRGPVAPLYSATAPRCHPITSFTQPPPACDTGA